MKSNCQSTMLWVTGHSSLPSGGQHSVTSALELVSQKSRCFGLQLSHSHTTEHLNYSWYNYSPVTFYKIAESTTVNWQGDKYITRWPACDQNEGRSNRPLVLEGARMEEARATSKYFQSFFTYWLASLLSSLFSTLVHIHTGNSLLSKTF